MKVMPCDAWDFGKGIRCVAFRIICPKSLHDLIIDFERCARFGTQSNLLKLRGGNESAGDSPTNPQGYRFHPKGSDSEGQPQVRLL
jgi:hypothetical protein